MKTTYKKWILAGMFIVLLSGCQRLSDTDRNAFMGNAEIEITEKITEDMLMMEAEQEPAEETEITGTLSETEKKVDRTEENLCADAVLCAEAIEYDINSFLTYVWKDENYVCSKSEYGELFTHTEGDWVLHHAQGGVRYEKVEAKSSIYNGVTATYLPFLGQQAAYLRKRYPAVTDKEQQAAILEQCNAYVNALGVSYSEVEMYRLDLLQQDNFSGMRSDLNKDDEEWWILYRRPKIHGTYQESLQGEGMTIIYYSLERGVLMLYADPSNYKIIEETSINIISMEDALNKISGLAVRYMIDPELIKVTDLELVYVADIKMADKEYMYLRPCWRIEYASIEGEDPFYIDKEIGWTYGPVSDELGYLLLDAESGDITYYFVGG